MKYIDIHSHLGFEDYGQDQEEVIKRMKESEVGTIAVGSNFSNSKDAVKVASENEDVFACIGIHPDEKEVFIETDFEVLIKNPKVVAVGECGLDYMEPRGLEVDKIGTIKTKEEKERQKVEFRKQIEFALKHNKPLMLHIRDGEVRGEAYEDAYNLLKEYEGKVKGNFHFFTGSLGWAEKFIALGFTVSFTGLITYVRDFDKIIRNVPLESLQAETDAPYVAPVPHRGERNEPTYVIHIYQKIAEIRGEDPEKVRLQLLENANHLFGI